MRTKPQTAHLMASPDDVEAQFYEALREADLDRLMAVWADDDEIVCVHPGGLRAVGVLAVRAAFEALFANNKLQAWAEQVRRVHTLESAVHSVIERIEVATAEGPRTVLALATNVYHKTAQGWRLVAHHVSPGTTGEVPEIAPAPSTLH